jgi:branched-chain amino acid transport system permease protein
MSYFLHLYIIIIIYILLSLGLNLLIGYTGLVSLCHAAFFGLGAYTSTLLMMKVGLPFIVALPSCILITALFSLLLSLPSIKLRGDFFVLTTFAFQIIFYDIIYNWSSLTGGSIGIMGIPRPSFWGMEIIKIHHYVLLATVFCLIAIALFQLIVKSPFGRILEGIREDEIAMIALGKNVTQYKILVFTIGTGFAAAAGSLYAHYVIYIDPSGFTLDESIYILCIVIIGGMGSLSGSIVGALLLILIPEILRVINLPNELAANLRAIIFGILLVTFVFIRPKGIIGKYRLR